LDNFYPFLSYVLVTTFTPGPNNLMSMSNAARFGYKKTLGFLAGIFSGFLIIMLACGLLNVFLENLIPQVGFWLNLLGAAYMIYLAIHIARSAPVENDLGGDQLNTFTAGFVLQFLNPKVILYGITVYALFITRVYPQWLVAATFAPLLASVGFISITCWALGGHVFHHFLNKYYRILNLLMAGLLVYPAIASLLSH
jgi:cysteine/O-acetylserine efflux protein